MYLGGFGVAVDQRRSEIRTRVSLPAAHFAYMALAPPRPAF